MSSLLKEPNSCAWEIKTSENSWSSGSRLTVHFNEVSGLNVAVISGKDRWSARTIAKNVDTRVYISTETGNSVWIVAYPTSTKTTSLSFTTSIIGKQESGGSDFFKENASEMQILYFAAGGLVLLILLALLWHFCKDPERNNKVAKDPYSGDAGETSGPHPSSYQHSYDPSNPEQSGSIPGQDSSQRLSQNPGNVDPTMGAPIVPKMERDPSAPKHLNEIKEEYWQAKIPQQYGDDEGNPNLRDNPLFAAKQSD